jgi:hypothetical protein
LVFFDVRARLSVRSFIEDYVIGPALYMGFTEHDVEVAWKFFALEYGGIVLDDLIELLGHSDAGSARTEYQTNWLQCLRILIYRHSRILNEETPPEFVSALLAEQELRSRDRERRMAAIPPSFDATFEVECTKAG